jgi:hypothetical protein
MYHAVISYLVIQFYIQSELMIDLKFRIIKVTKLKIGMCITLHVIFKLHIPFMINVIQLYLYRDCVSLVSLYETNTT